MTDKINDLVSMVKNFSIEELLKLKKAFEEAGFNMNATAAGAVEEEVEVVAEKSEWTLKIKSFPDSAKMSVLMALKNALALSIGDAKKMVETPQVEIKKGSKDDLTKLMNTLKTAVATLEMELV